MLMFSPEALARATSFSGIQAPENLKNRTTYPQITYRRLLSGPWSRQVAYYAEMDDFPVCLFVCGLVANSCLGKLNTLTTDGQLGISTCKMTFPEAHRFVAERVKAQEICGLQLSNNGSLAFACD